MLKKKNINNIPQNSGKARVHLIDEIRGFLVICMVFYHAFYSLAFIFNISWAKNFLYLLKPFQLIFAGAFIFISGSVSLLSRSNLKRGAKLFALAVAISFITKIFIPSQVIIFGVLHMLSICMMLFGALEPILAKVNPYLGITTCLFLFLLTFNIQNGFLGFGNFRIYIPLSAYTLNWLFPFGVANKNFYSSDYFPLLPWIFIFFLGAFFAMALKGKKLPQFISKPHVPALSFCGRHALIIYILHQPIIFLIMNLYLKIKH